MYKKHKVYVSQPYPRPADRGFKQKQVETKPSPFFII